MCIENYASKPNYPRKENAVPNAVEKYRAKSVYHLQQPAIALKLDMRLRKETILESSPTLSSPVGRRIPKSLMKGCEEARLTARRCH